MLRNRKGEQYIYSQANMNYKQISLIRYRFIMAQLARLNLVAMLAKDAVKLCWMGAPVTKTGCPLIEASYKFVGKQCLRVKPEKVPARILKKEEKTSGKAEQKKDRLILTTMSKLLKGETSNKFIPLYPLHMFRFCLSRSICKLTQNNSKYTQNIK